MTLDDMGANQSYMDDVHLRPLPPPSGRDVVKRQARVLGSSGWNTVDDMEGLQLAKAHRDLRFLQANDDIDPSNSCSRSSSARATPKLESNNAFSTNLAQQHHLDNPAAPEKKIKKRLFETGFPPNSAQTNGNPTPVLDAGGREGSSLNGGFEQVEASLPISNDLGGGQNLGLADQPRRQSTAFCDTGADDEGYFTQPTSPQNEVGTNPTIQEFEGEDELVRCLTRFHQSSVDEEGSKEVETKTGGTDIGLSTAEVIPGLDFVAQDIASGKKSEHLRENHSGQQGAETASYAGGVTSSTELDEDQSSPDLFSGSDEEPPEELSTYAEPEFDLDALLDQAQSYGRRTKAKNRAEYAPFTRSTAFPRPAKSVSTTPESRRRFRRDPNALHPASRQAAEQYRTQSRHADPAALQLSSARTSTEAGEDRLRAFTALHRGGSAPEARFVPTSQHKEYFLKGAPIRALHQPSPGVRIDSLTRDESFHDTNNEGEDDALASRAEHRDETRRGDGLSNHRAFSTLELLAMKARPHTASEGNGTFPSLGIQRRALFRPTVDPLKGLVKELPRHDLSVPPTFDRFSEESQQIVIDCERLKERKRDLDAIKVALQEVARLATGTELTIEQEDEVAEIQVFKDRVLEGFAMKLKRPRINAIKDNFKRRRQKSGSEPASEESVEELYLALVGQDNVELLELEVDKVVSELEDLKPRRAAVKFDRQNESKRQARVKNGAQKRVHFAPDVDIFGHDKAGYGTQRPRKKHKPNQAQWTGTATENRRDAQHKRLDERQALLQSRLAEFDSALQSPKPATGPTSSGQNEEASTLDSESEVSEEDDGQGYQYFGGNNSFTGPPPSTSADQSSDLVMEELDDNEINRLETERQLANNVSRATTPGPETASIVEGSQRFDPELLRQMLGRQRNVVTTRTSQNDSDEESSDSESTTSGPDDEIEPKPVHLYHVRGVFQNHSNYDADDEPEFQPFLSLNDAETALKDFLNTVQNSHRPSARSIQENSTWHGGLLEKRLEIKYDDPADDQRSSAESIEGMICRMWIEREVHEPNKRAWRQQKLRKAAKAKDVWIVQWEKTVTPVTDDGAEDEVEVGTQGHMAEEHMATKTIATGRPPADTTLEPSTTTSPAEVAAEPAEQDTVMDDLQYSSLPSSETTLDTNDLDNLFEDASSPPQQDRSPGVSNDTATRPDQSPTPSPQPQQTHETAPDAQSQPRLPSQTPSLLNLTPQPASPAPATTQQPPHPSPPDHRMTSSHHNPPTTTTSTTKNPNLLLYTTPFLANIHAKSIMLDWYAQFYPGWDNLPYLQQIEDELHAELDRLGDVSGFERSDEFIRHGTVEEGEGEVKESMRVWVRRVGVLGPGN